MVKRVRPFEKTIRKIGLEIGGSRNGFPDENHNFEEAETYAMAKQTVFIAVRCFRVGFGEIVEESIVVAFRHQSVKRRLA